MNSGPAAEDRRCEIPRLKPRDVGGPSRKNEASRAISIDSATVCLELRVSPILIYSVSLTIYRAKCEPRLVLPIWCKTFRRGLQSNGLREIEGRRPCIFSWFAVIKLEQDTLKENHGTAVAP